MASDTNGLADLSDEQLSSLVANYRRLNKTEGGKWSLAEATHEQSRRAHSEFEPVPMIEAILRLARESDDQQVSYADLWRAFKPDVNWQAYNSQKQVTNGLAKVGAYCVDHGLPMLSVLVVPSGTRTLTDEAAANIWSFARSIGVNAGPDARTYVEGEKVAAIELLHHREKSV